MRSRADAGEGAQHGVHDLVMSNFEAKASKLDRERKELRSGVVLELGRATFTDWKTKTRQSLFFAYFADNVGALIRSCSKTRRLGDPAELEQAVWQVVR